jgi:hypothetical protein
MKNNKYLATFTFDKDLHLLQFKCKDTSITSGVSTLWKNLELVTVDNDYIEFNTDTGIESYEILEHTKDMLSDTQLKHLKAILPLLSKENIKVRCI